MTVTTVTVLQKNRYKGTASSSMSGLNKNYFQRAIDRGNGALLPLEWSDWSDFYQPVALAGTELIGCGFGANFVLRIPDHWNGMLVSAATPATRDAYSLDIYFADSIQSQGFAFLASDKGTPGRELEGDPFAAAKNALLERRAMECWHDSFAGLTAWAQHFLAQDGRDIDLNAGVEFSVTGTENFGIKTFAVGLSNGGYVVRRALERDSNMAHLFAGGLEVEGVCWLPEVNLISTLRDFILEYTALRAAKTDNEKSHHRARLLALGLPDCPEPLWRFYHEYYWFIVFNIYRDYFDRDFASPLPWQQYLELASNGLRKKDHDLDLVQYHWADRLAQIELPKRLINSGNLEAPLISIYGSWDCLCVPRYHLSAYADCVNKQGKADLHRIYEVERATHIDSLVHSLWDSGKELQPMLPEAQARFKELVSWIN